jgi:hypothetical protein
MLRILAARGERYMDAEDLATVLGKKPSGGHWNSGIAVLRNNGLIETEPAPAQAGGRALPDCRALPGIAEIAALIANRAVAYRK